LEVGRSLIIGWKGYTVTLHRIVAVSQLCILLCLINCRTAESFDDLTRTRFLDAVQETRKRIADPAFSCDLRIAHRADFESISAQKRAEWVAAGRDPDVPDTNEWRVMISGENALEAISRHPPAEVITSRNADYAFLINRIAKDAKCTLGGLEQNISESNISAKIIEAVANARASAIGNWFVNYEPLDRLVASPTFRLIDAEEIEWKGTKAVKVAFERPDTRDVLRDFGPSYLICDTSQHWAILEYELKVGPTAVQHVEMDFGEAINGFPIPKKMVRRSFGTQGVKSVRRIVFDIELLRTSVPDSEFRLSHYGLPEPVFTKSSRRGWLWYLAGGIALITFGVMIRRRRQRVT